MPTSAALHRAALGLADVYLHHEGPFDPFEEDEELMHFIAAMDEEMGPEVHAPSLGPSFNAANVPSAPSHLMHLSHLQKPTIAAAGTACQHPMCALVSGW